MSLYKQFKTDPELERKGILLEYGLNSKGKPITIRIARAGGANERYLKRLDALTKPYRRQIQTETMDRKQMEDLVKQAYAECVVLGWENVEDADGNEMEFTRENVLKLFSDLPDLYADIMEQAQKGILFREMIREEDAKNS